MAVVARRGMIHNEVTGIKGITHAYTKGIPDNFGEGLTTRAGNPDIGLARAQKEERIAALKEAGIEVVVFPNYGHADETYFRDLAHEHKDTVFMGNPATPSRKREVEPAFSDLSSVFRNVVPWQGSPTATVEFGDVVYIGKNTYIIGLSERTNPEGARDLMVAMRDVDPEVKFLLAPVKNVLHFETGATPVTESLLLRDPHMPLPSFISNNMEVITVPHQNGYAASVLTVNDTVLVAKEHREVEQLVIELSIPGLKIVTVSTSETERMNGSLPCDFVLSNANYGGHK